MSTGLSSQQCEVCRVGAPLLDESDKATLLPQIPEWEIIVDANVEQLQRKFSFVDFASALAFTNQVGAIAEQSGHHPALLLEWGSVTVRWWTHKIKGLHQNDVIMAAKTDALL